jgi:hypothetical protein
MSFYLYTRVVEELGRFDTPDSPAEFPVKADALLAL